MNKVKLLVTVGLGILFTYPMMAAAAGNPSAKANSGNPSEIETSQTTVKTTQVAELVLEKGLEQADLGKYPGSLLLHAMSELALMEADGKMLTRVLTLFSKFKTGEIDAKANFISYEAGGSGAAYLYFLKKKDALAEQVLDNAAKMVKDQKRTSEGLLTSRHIKEGSDRIFIDVAFAVTPFLLYAGLASDNKEYVDLAVYETLELFKILTDTNGLLRQARGFHGYNSISEDNWSRGNGWGAFALALLARDLPESHPRKKEVDQLANNFFSAVMRYQNKEGMWHQEMTDPTSYVETSGSGLLLYGVGIAIEKNIIDAKYLDSFKKGLAGYLSYISGDGSISHTCIGCLAPGNGTKQDYVKHRWKLNDSHAFGPAVLAYTQAIKMGIREITATQPLGKYIIPGDTIASPRAYVRYIPEANGNIFWENDRIAFRMYGPEVKSRVGSGIDIWAKSVEYPIINKWQRLSKAGKSYHEDSGEGCDFFEVGFSRGVGGTAIWHNNRPYPSLTYASHKIIKNNERELEFEVTYAPWQVGNRKISEVKTVNMKMGTNLFKVTSRFSSETNDPITVGIGISSAKTPVIVTDSRKGLLVAWESYLPKNGELGTAVMTDPQKETTYKSHENEHFALVTIAPETPLVYYVGAASTKAPQFRSKEDWYQYVNEELARLQF